MGVNFGITDDAMKTIASIIVFLQINICMCFTDFYRFNEFYQDQMANLMDVDESWKDFAKAVAIGSMLTASDFTNETRADDNIEPPSQSIEQVAETKTYGGFSEDKAYNIVAKTLYDEARGESIMGLKAVASVIYNRAGGDSQNFPEVCLRKYQFSGWNGLDESERTPEGYYIVKPDTSTQETKDKWGLCMALAKMMFEGKFKSTIEKRNSFYNPNKSSPTWGSIMKDPLDIGNHRFGYLPEYDGFKAKGTQVASIK